MIEDMKDNLKENLPKIRFYSFILVIAILFIALFFGSESQKLLAIVFAICSSIILLIGVKNLEEI